MIWIDIRQHDTTPASIRTTRMTTSTLVSTAAAAAAVVPFHCIICFDEFNLKLRYPVVLPCGHTYVCNPCARRLKRCMECREPLFINAALKNPLVHAPVNGNYSRGPPLYPQGRYQAPSSPVPAAVVIQQSEPIALPLPKNVILMTMMEAALSQARIQEEEEEDCIGPEVTHDEVETRSLADDDNDEDEYSSNMIISGMVNFSGPCGTYVVRDVNGLAVLPSHPEKGCQPLEAEREHRLNSEARVEPFTIFQGQTVQLVNFSDGVAKLARGAGFIVATASQLVKVGAPHDRCCRLEGMAETLSLRGIDLQGALSENQQLEAHLKKQVAKESQHEPLEPIISEVPVENSDTELSRSNTAKLGSAGSVSDNPLLIPASPREVFLSEGNDLSGLDLVGVTRLPLSPHSIDNSECNRTDANAPGMPRYRRNNDDDLNEFSYGCGSSLFGKGFLNFEDAEHGVGLSFDSLDDVHQSRGSHPTQTDAVRTDQANTSSPSRPLQNQTHLTNFMATASPMLSSSFDTVDWRTGLSGHRALSKTSPRPTHLSRNVRLMSEHRGAGGSGRASSPSSSPASGQFRSPNEYDEHNI